MSHPLLARRAQSLAEILWVNRIKHLLRKHNIEQEYPTKKQGSKTARFILGQMVMHVLRRDAAMKAWYGGIKKRRGVKIARVAVMRRLATIIWHMLKHEEPYLIGRPPRRKLPRKKVVKWIF